MLQRAIEGAALTNLRCWKERMNSLCMVEAGIFKGRTARGRKKEEVYEEEGKV